ncbi:MAG: 4Fe-4S double cluster binding domain-containing protein [Candidatus Zixiibacteriota bacterium]
MNKNNLCLQLKMGLFRKGASLVGFADLMEIPADVRYSLRFAVSIAVALDPGIIASISNGPNQQYYSEYKRVNALLSDLGEHAAKMIRSYGYQALSSPPTIGRTDTQTDGTPLPHKTVATKAGLGWIGKCALLITEEYGSAIRLTKVLTDAALETAIPITDSRCGKCEICVKSCPGNAPSGRDWSINLRRDDFFDASACYRTARELASKAGIDESLCGICVSVCPWTQKYIKGKRTPRRA